MLHLHAGLVDINFILAKQDWKRRLHSEDISANIQSDNFQNLTQTLILMVQVTLKVMKCASKLT